MSAPRISPPFLLLLLLLLGTVLAFRPSGWDEWLDKVRYIATKKEKQEYRFLKKSGDEKKIMTFRALFWKLRDPDPRTARNTFREQYYRRINEANGLFNESSTPGWLTDRGKVYILLGPPDDMTNEYDRPSARGGVDSFTFSPSERYPTQLWIYRNTPSPTVGPNLEIRFLRQSGTGEYKMASKVDLRINRLTGRREIYRDPYQIYREALTMSNPFGHPAFTGIVERTEDLVQSLEPVTSPPFVIAQSLQYNIEQSKIGRERGRVERIRNPVQSIHPPANRIYG